MLKNIFKKEENNQNKDPLKFSLADGYIDIKGYKVHKDGTKELVYHDTGDNVVTEWMRHAIISMLGGYIFSETGNKQEEYYSLLNTAKACNGKNIDGYIVNGKQFLDTEARNNISNNAQSVNAKNVYAMYPTKVLFGTGKEYSDFDTLSAENSVVNQSWYNSIVAEYGGIQAAKQNFDNNINLKTNKFSGTIANNKHSGSGSIIPCRTVNDPDSTSTIVQSSSTMARNYNVVGAVKTIYTGENNEVLEETITDPGLLLKNVNRGVGRPCFIYFTQHNNWASQSSEIALSKDSSSDYLNKITFKIEMPSQTNENIGQYYPYNGYTIKQIGLYNDALLDNSGNGSSEADEYGMSNMPCGMLLALKNITSFAKTDDNELTMTWTLTI